MLVVLKNGTVMKVGDTRDRYDDRNNRVTVDYKPKMISKINTAIAASVGVNHGAILVMNRGW